MIRIPPLQELRKRDSIHEQLVDSLVAFAAETIGVEADAHAAWIEANNMFRDEVQVYLVQQERAGKRSYEAAEWHAVNNIRVLLAARQLGSRRSVK